MTSILTVGEAARELQVAPIRLRHSTNGLVSKLHGRAVRRQQVHVARANLRTAEIAHGGRLRLAAGRLDPGDLCDDVDGHPMLFDRRSGS